MGAVRTTECERARTWVSLGLDGELSEFEQALLRAHIGRCATCAVFACDVDALTWELRAAPLERPAVASMPCSRSVGMRRLQVGAAAAAVLLAAGFGSLAGSLNVRNAPGSTVATTSSTDAVAFAPREPVPAGRHGRSVAL